jgi:S-formylglutathione hydrolase FrmB
MLALILALQVSEAVKDSDGLLVHAVKSEYQAGETKIRVLLPDKVGKDHAVLYVLPVEANDEQRWGNGLLEVKRHDLHNRHGLVVVAPTFSQLPWYADHPTDPAIRQESHFLKVVLPFVEKTFPVRAERLLLGFSKSGCGAWSLLLRHPDRFARAAAWDAPLWMDKHAPYGAGPIFGTQENFERYRPATLLRAEPRKADGRLLHLGYGNFRKDHLAMEALLEELKVAREFRDGPERKHAWESGWVPEAVELLVAERRK